ncbi:hypothetical protein GCM10023191_074030 [Actinoallomurus oryzae]|uniref:Uncharacterized protein n=1 Tax=Actinoallomurus oryzae TaxID=502180 RepID=A0ABP8QUP6_9ACTN
MRALMPFAVAWQDAIGVMTREQLASASKMDLLALNTVKLVVDLDALLGEKIFSALPMEVTMATEDDLEAWEYDEVAALIDRFRTLVSKASTLRVELANSPLVRKIKGARDALDHSADGVSQAANSLIELIDRLMRETFDQATVLRWLDANFPGDTSLIHIERGQRRPTKRAEALCLVYGGGSAARPSTETDDGTGPSIIHDALARAIVIARTNLQRLKHSDGDLHSDREELRMLMSAVEGALMIGLLLGFIASDDDDQAALSETA